jgi:MFS family permease
MSEIAQQAPQDISTRGPAAVSWNTALSTYLPALILASGTGIVLPAIPMLAKSYDVSFGVASGLITAFLLGNLFISIPAGWLIDRFGYRKVMIAGPLVTAVAAFLCATAFSFNELLVLRFINGCGAQMWIMSRLAAISADAAPDQRARLVSWMFGMDNSGRLTGPLIGGFIAASFGPSAPFIVYGAFSLLALVPTLVFNKTWREADAAVARKNEKTTMTIRDIVMPRLVYFAVGLFAGLTRGPLQADLFHLYAAFTYRLDAQQIGYLATAGAALSWPTGFVAGWIMDRFGRKQTMVPGFIGVACSMAALALSAFLHLSVMWYVALFLLGVFTQSITGGSIQTVGADVAPPQARGRFLGLWRFTGQSGATISPIIFAFIATQVNYGMAFLFTAVCAGVVAFFLIAYVPETRTAQNKTGG